VPQDVSEILETWKEVESVVERLADRLYGGTGSVDLENLYGGENTVPWETRSIIARLYPSTDVPPLTLLTRTRPASEEAEWDGGRKLTNDEVAAFLSDDSPKRNE
jgi:hypothetical protein